MTKVSKSALEFLNKLKKNNNREWFDEHKSEFKEEETKLKDFYNAVLEDLNQSDTIEKMKVFRIYRDVRFSKDKTPYNYHRSISFSRATEKLRGGYYLKISPGESMMAGGFFKPSPADLLRIRKEFETDDFEIREIIAEENFQKLFGDLEGEEVKSAPRGFDKNHASIDLIRKKSFLVTRNFSDEEVLSQNFREELKLSYLALRPFFDYMSDVLTTDINGESILKE
ncbi:DUF2461 domain-containing protein [Flavicella sp.]|uniref:DUF2461 domain-containing protein n=1 Tax=Flavicella sp. TaxID=2957742 RepID=UPI00263213B7|nr:DUF2461 domain-containing protein [Flavicella sp.]MDG1805444.1 DUF2461 domain-containing protein [Flavicella sp.]